MMGLMKKRLFLWLALLAFVMTAGAQTERRIYTKAEQESAKKREVEKRLAAIQDSIRAVEAFSALERLDFVIEANRLSFKRGENAFVTSNTNFVSLSDDQAVIQIAPFFGGGPNGVGGITLEGKASRIKLKTDKKGNVIFTMNVMGTGLSAKIDIFLPKNSYMASVTVNPTFHSNRVTLYGDLLSSSKSNVFKGRAF